MLGLSFDTKSNVSVFAMYLNAKISFTFYVAYFTHVPISTKNKMFCITSRRYGDNA